MSIFNDDDFWEFFDDFWLKIAFIAVIFFTATGIFYWITYLNELVK